MRKAPTIIKQQSVTQGKLTYDIWVCYLVLNDIEYELKRLNALEQAEVWKNDFDREWDIEFKKSKNV